jgi:hypothetical protein
MNRFIARFIGALALDASVFEDIERDRSASMQSIVVVIAAACGARVAFVELGVMQADSFIAGLLMALGALFIWVSLVAVIGTYALAQPQTRSSVPELLRTLGFAAAPGVFLSLAAIPPAAPVIIPLAGIWMLAAAVIAVRQSLDYDSTARAIGVCVLGGVLCGGAITAIVLMFGRNVS